MTLTGRRIGRLAVVAVALVGVGAACSSDSKKADTSSGSSAAAPEDVRAPDSAVASGLRQIASIAHDIAAAAATGNKTQAKDLDSRIEPIWRTIEGTVKANDKDTYLAFEDSFAAMEKAADDGNGATASATAAKIDQSMTGYVAKHPG